jgi:hypothetical protein
MNFRTTESRPQVTLNQAMITALYGGAATLKKAVSYPDVRRTWILFGDADEVIFR